MTVDKIEDANRDSSPEDKLRRAFFVFTENLDSTQDLMQGDLLSTGVLADGMNQGENPVDLLKDIYPYFFKTYSLAVVINATCDLVGDRAARCIHLLAVAPFDEILGKIIADLPFQSLGVCDEASFKRIRDTVRRSTDGQHNEHYFMPAPMLKELVVPLAVKLDVGVSIRFDKRNAFKLARIGCRLTEIRAAKLAESYGNLYNRIALEDVSDILGKEGHIEWLDGIMERRLLAVKNASYDASLIQLKALKKIRSSKTSDELLKDIKEILESHKSAKDIKELISIFESIQKEMTKAGISEDRIGQVILGLRGTDQKFMAIINKSRSRGVS